jgi:hypothetical protein
MGTPQPTGFVVKATSERGLERWISPPRAGKDVIFGLRENAEVFQTRAAAHSAISKLSHSPGQAGFTFSVEAAE